MPTANTADIIPDQPSAPDDNAQVTGISVPTAETDPVTQNVTQNTAKASDLAPPDHNTLAADAQDQLAKYTAGDPALGAADATMFQGVSRIAKEFNDAITGENQAADQTPTWLRAAKTGYKIGQYLGSGQATTDIKNWWNKQSTPSDQPERQFQVGFSPDPDSVGFSPGQIKSAAELAQGAFLSVPEMIPAAVNLATGADTLNPITALEETIPGPLKTDTQNRLAQERAIGDMLNHYVNTGANDISRVTGISHDTASAMIGENLGMALMVPAGELNLAEATASAVDRAVNSVGNFTGAAKWAAAKSAPTAVGLAKVSMIDSALHRMGMSGLQDELLSWWLGFNKGTPNAQIANKIVSMFSDKSLDDIAQEGAIAARKPLGMTKNEALSAAFRTKANIIQDGADELGSALDPEDLNQVKSVGQDGEYKIPDDALSPDQLRVREMLDQAGDLHGKADALLTRNAAQKIWDSGVRAFGNIAAHSAMGAAAGAAFTGSQGTTGNTTQAALSGATLGGVLGLATAPFATRTGMFNQRMAEGKAGLIKASLDADNVHYDDGVDLTQPEQDYVRTMAGAAHGIGDRKVFVHTPEGLGETGGITEGADPGNGFVDPDGNIHLNADTIPSLAASHEYTHVTQRFFGEMLRNADPAEQARFDQVYQDALSATGRTKFNSQAERDAEVGRMVLSHTPVEYFYGGETGGDIVKRALGGLMGDNGYQTWGGFQTPINRSDIAAMRQRFFKAGDIQSRVAQGAPVPDMPVRPPPVPPEGVSPEDFYQQQHAAIKQSYIDQGIPEPMAQAHADADMQAREAEMPPKGTGIEGQFMPRTATNIADAAQIWDESNDSQKNNIIQWSGIPVDSTNKTFQDLSPEHQSTVLQYLRQVGQPEFQPKTKEQVARQAKQVDWVKYFHQLDNQLPADRPAPSDEETRIGYDSYLANRQQNLGMSLDKQEPTLEAPNPYKRVYGWLTPEGKYEENIEPDIHQHTIARLLDRPELAEEGYYDDHNKWVDGAEMEDAYRAGWQNGYLRLRSADRGMYVHYPEWYGDIPSKQAQALKDLAHEYGQKFISRDMDSWHTTDPILWKNPNPPPQPAWLDDEYMPRTQEAWDTERPFTRKNIAMLAGMAREDGLKKFEQLSAQQQRQVAKYYNPATRISDYETSYDAMPPVPDSERFPNFRNWFGSSKVVDEQGNPKPLFHATDAPQDFEAFDQAKVRSLGFHFGTEDQANYVANNKLSDFHMPGSQAEYKTGARILPVFLKMEHPLQLDNDWGFTSPDRTVGQMRQRQIINDEEEKILSDKIKQFDNGDRDLRIKFNLASGKLRTLINTLEDDYPKEWEKAQNTQFGSEGANPRSYARLATIADETKNPELAKLASDIMKAHTEITKSHSEWLSSLPSFDQRAAHNNQLIADMLKSKGYDGIIYPNEFEGNTKIRQWNSGDSYAVFDPNQVKSALGGQYTNDSRLNYMPRYESTKMSPDKPDLYHLDPREQWEKASINDRMMILHEIGAPYGDTKHRFDTLPESEQAQIIQHIQTHGLPSEGHYFQPKNPYEAIIAAREKLLGRKLEDVRPLPPKNAEKVYGWLAPNGKFEDNGEYAIHQGTIARLLNRPELDEGLSAKAYKEGFKAGYLRLTSYRSAKQLYVHYPAAYGELPLSQRKALIQLAEDKGYISIVRDYTNSDGADSGKPASVIWRSSIPEPKDYMPKVDPNLENVIKDYAASTGLKYTPHTAYRPLNEGYSKNIADAYAMLKHNPDDPRVQKSYDSLRDAIMAQYNTLVKHGYKIEPWTGEGQPYANSSEMLNDLRGNKHLYYFPTENGYGDKGGSTAIKHPMLRGSGVYFNGKEALVNDIFRGVHDALGHGTMGTQFGPRGEYNAFLTHASTLPHESWGALATETLGQNSWTNFGPHMRDELGNIRKPGEPGYLNLQDRPFTEQRANLLDFQPKIGETAPNIITKNEVEGTNSRPVSYDEFLKLRAQGKDKLKEYQTNSSPTDGLNQNWDAIKSHAYTEAQKPWGGTTIDSHTGKPITGSIGKGGKTGEGPFSLVGKNPGDNTIEIPENATKAQFNKAMDLAKEKFPQLQYENYGLGVFHDNKKGTIDIDPVITVPNAKDAEAIGTHTRAIGGAYDYATGNGLFPPHYDPSLDTRLPQRTSASGKWDNTFVGEGTAKREALASQLGADSKKHFTEQKPEVQQAIRNHFMATEGADYQPKAEREVPERFYVQTRYGQHPAIMDRLTGKMVDTWEGPNPGDYSSSSGYASPQELADASNQDRPPLPPNWTASHPDAFIPEIINQHTDGTWGIEGPNNTIQGKFKTAAAANAALEEAHRSIYNPETPRRLDYMPRFTRQGASRNSDPDALKSPAVLDNFTGKTYTGGDNHYAIYKSNGLDYNDQHGRYTDGFVTNSGKFLNRMEGAHIGEHFNQIKSGSGQLSQDYDFQPSAIEAAKDLATKSNNARTNLEDKFFGEIWPRLLKQTKLTVSPNRDSSIRLAADRAVGEVSDYLKNNPSYADYYSKDYETTHNILNQNLGKIPDDQFRLFQIMNGIFSNQTALRQNTAESIDSLKLFRKQGNLDGISTFTNPDTGRQKMGESPFSISSSAAPTKAFAANVVNNLIKKMGLDGAINFLQEPVSVKDLNAFNNEVGYKSPAVSSLPAIREVVQHATGQSEEIPRIFIFGKKVGAYALNSLGDHRYNTIDTWESRFIRSYFKGLWDKQTGIAGADEHELFNKFVGHFNDIYRRDVDPNATSSSLQAARWYYILDAAKKAGYNRSITNQTISEYTQKYFEQPDLFN